MSQEYLFGRNLVNFGYVEFVVRLGSVDGALAKIGWTEKTEAQTKREIWAVRET